MKDLLNRASIEDVIVTGRLLVEDRRGDNDWFVGIAHDRRFGRSRAYPVAGVTFGPLENVNVRLAFPDPNVTVRLSKRQSIRAGLYPSGHQWHVVSDDFSSDFDYRIEAWRGQITWRLPLGRMLGADISAGYEFGREHLLTSDSGPRLDLAVDDQWFWGIGIRMGPAPFPTTHGTNL